MNAAHSNDRADRHSEHDQGHPEHRPNRGGRLRLALGHAFGHSHDSVEQIDDALESDRAGRRALIISVVGLGVTTVIQAAVVLVSGSVALLGDTVHNLADALTAVPLAIAFALSRRVPTRRFTYGYGRSEDIAGVVIVLTIAASSLFAGYEAIRRLIDPQPVTHLAAVTAAAVVGFGGNELVARYRIRVGRQIGSAALVADGLHARTDGFTSLAVLVGAAGVALGWQLADPIVGLVITVAIAGVLHSAAREVLNRLLDAVDPELVDQTYATLEQTPGIENVREVRLRWIGHSLRAEADVVVANDLSLTDAHKVAHDAERLLLGSIHRLAAATIHTSPKGAHH